MSGVIEWCFRGHKRGNQNIKPSEILTLSGPWLRSDSWHIHAISAKKSREFFDEFPRQDNDSCVHIVRAVAAFLRPALQHAHSWMTCLGLPAMSRSCLRPLFLFVRQAKQALVLIAHGGIALTSRLYWVGVRPALPIVLASGYVMSSDRLHGLDVIFLKKPYATHELQRVLLSCVS
jgi:hypothetical protein